MKFTKFGHACFLIEEGNARLLVDPGSYSEGFERLTNLDAILISHQHQDHLSIENITALLEGNPKAIIIADSQSGGLLKDDGIESKVVKGGDNFDISGVKVEVIGDTHAVIHPNFPTHTNVGYLFADKLFFPGDALTLPEREIEILAIPSVAPWSKASETIDYLLAVKPKVAIPVHDAITTSPEMYDGFLAGVGKEMGIEVRQCQNGSTLEL
jgi:L-ascorbate metabolism protein UlaG (beta-lactamase superfamily)